MWDKGFNKWQRGVLGLASVILFLGAFVTTSEGSYSGKSALAPFLWAVFLLVLALSPRASEPSE